MGKRQGYGQFCPIARAAEVLATRWTPLVVRELYFGSTQFNELRRGLPRISTALLSQRLKELELNGLVESEPIETGPGHSYRLTEAGRALFPVLESMGRWAQEHSRDDMTRDENLDPDLLMWNIRRRATREGIPEGQRFVISFHFLGVPAPKSRFWLLFEDEGTEVCLRDPGFETGLSVTVHIRTMTEIWLGHRPLASAIRTGALMLDGARDHVRAFPKWFNVSILALRNNEDLNTVGAEWRHRSARSDIGIGTSHGRKTDID